MQQRLSSITLGADNLKALRDFYVDTFGWKPVAENKDIVFFKLNGFLLSLYGREDLKKMVGLPLSSEGFRSLTLAQMMNSGQEVEDLHTQLKSRHVKIVQPPQAPPFGGLFFLFADPEDNIWEIAYNPFIPIDESGNVITHKSIDHL